MARTVRTLSLIEVIFAMAVLTIAMLGVAATFSVVQASQGTTKERQAVHSSAMAMMDTIHAWPFYEITNQFDETGFDVKYSINEVGFEDVGEASPAQVLKPGGASFYPASRAAKSAAIKAQAGYIEVQEVRPGLLEVQVTISWASVSGNGRTERLTLVERVAQ